MKTEILRMEHISKSLNHVKILDDFKLNVYKGEVLGVVGLSGAGKTIIANILAGLVTVDHGRIYYKEELLQDFNRNMRRQPDIYIIHNTVRLVPQLSVAENIFVIKKNNNKKIIINQKAMNHQTKILLEELGLNIHPQILAGELSYSEQHLVELAKATALNAKLIVLDEITESYTLRELVRLKKAINHMKKKGIAFIYESHNLKELLDFADRISVLRDGNNVSTLHKDEYDKNKILSLLVGSEFRERNKKDNTNTGKRILQVNHLNTGRLKNMSFTLHKGEVLGIFDIENKANMEIYHLLSGAVYPFSGQVYLNGSKLVIKNIYHAVNSGIGLIPEQAADDKLFPNMNVGDNIAFLLFKKISNPFMCINNKAIYFIIREYGRLLGVEQEEIGLLIQSLDVYTRQRIMLYRWLLYRPKILVCANPGSMLDVVTKKMTYTFINEAAKQGIGIILVTSDLSEAANTCDRIIVLSGHEVKGVYSREEIQRLDINRLY